MPFFERRLASYEDDIFGDDPSDSCTCTIGTIDYSAIDRGVITCRECGRVWELRTRTDKNDESVSYGSWWPSPCPSCRRPAAECRHYGRKPKKKSVTRD